MRLGPACGQLSVVGTIVEYMSEHTDVDLIGAMPLEDLSDAELRAEADRLRTLELLLRQRMHAEVARRVTLVRRLRAAKWRRQRPRAG
jgi:hypothetical protein